MFKVIKPVGKDGKIADRPRQRKAEGGKPPQQVVLPVPAQAGPQLYILKSLPGEHPDQDGPQGRHPHVKPQRSHPGQLALLQAVLAHQPAQRDPLRHRKPSNRPRKGKGDQNKLYGTFFLHGATLLFTLRAPSAPSAGRRWPGWRPGRGRLAGRCARRRWSDGRSPGRNRRCSGCSRRRLRWRSGRTTPAGCQGHRCGCLPPGPPPRAGSPLRRCRCKRGSGPASRRPRR